MNEQKFLSKISIGKPSECWLWTAYRNSKGYGMAKVDAGPPKLAHRIMWTISRGPIEVGLCVLHRCDTPACCNPSHLFLGTRLDNNLDCLRKGRGRRKRGESVWSATLTEEDVRQIRSRYLWFKNGYRKLAITFGVGKTTIEQIVKRKKWKHIN